MWTQAIAEHARTSPGADAVVTPERTVSYGRMAQDLDRFCHRIAALGLPGGAVVAAWVRDPYLQWLALLALGRLGFVSFSFFNEPFAELNYELARPVRVLTDRPQVGADPRFALIGADWLEAEARPFADARRDPARPARLQLSSGTTGKPKRMLWSQAAVELRVRNLIDRAMPPCARSLTLFLPQTGLGFAMPLATFVQGGAVLACDGLYWDASLWTLRPSLLAVTPRHLFEILASLGGDRPGPPPRVMTGGSMVPRSLQRAAMAKLTHDFHSWYGASEVGMIAHAPPEVLARHESAAGALLPGVEVRILGDAGQPLPPGQTGKVRLRTQAMATPHPGDPDLFEDGWFAPEDLGFVTPDGLLVLEGRGGEVMNFGGSKVSATDVESAAMSAPGVLDAAAFSMPGPRGLPILWVAVKTGPGYAEAALRSAIAPAARVKPVMVAQLRQIPRNAAGKIQRNLLAGLVRGRAGRRPAGPPRR